VSFGLMIEVLVAILLMLTIGYCYTLNRRLERLRADEQSLKGTIGELVTATEIAERAVAELKRAAHENDVTLGERVRSAEHCCVELDRQISAADVVLTRLSRVVVAARSLHDVPSAAQAPDPKAVAAAARSFADRLRERVGAAAA
jgi:predicted RNase H-like nuclease (RuvC/YqgF family)